jgi:hypothetical protein
MSTNGGKVKSVIAGIALVLGVGCGKNAETVATAAPTPVAAAPVKVKPLEAARLDALKKFDVNANGELDPAEKVRLVAERKARIETLKARINARYDRNGNGALEVGEVQTMQADTDRLSVFKGAALRRYDANHNGVLEPAERERMVSERQAFLANARGRLVAKYDTNGNGALDAPERAAMDRELESKKTNTK